MGVRRWLERAPRQRENGVDVRWKSSTEPGSWRVTCCAVALSLAALALAALCAACSPGTADNGIAPVGADSLDAGPADAVAADAPPPDDTSAPTEADAPDTAVEDSVAAETEAAEDGVAADAMELPGDATDDAAVPETAFRFQPVALTGVAPTWAAVTAGPYLLGGVNESLAVQSGVYTVAPTEGGFAASKVGAMDRARYCHCAMFDPGRKEIVVLGGRGAGFTDAPNAAVIDLTSGVASPLDASGAADYPVGCRAFFSVASDRGYVFGGLSDAKKAFTDAMYRWDPVARALTKLDAAGPPARYDAAVNVLNNGDALLVSGMGVKQTVVFYQDMWRFDAKTEQWSEITPASAVVPPGRRYAWTAVSPDESILVYGYGADAPDGSHVLGDLWTFTFATREWKPLAVEGELPPARGFLPNWQGVGEDAGIFAFGSDANLNVFSDAYVLRVPDALRGAWH